MERDSYLQRREGVLVQQMDEQQILLDPSSGQYYTLNEVGRRIWELSDGARSVSEIVDIVCQEYDAPRERVEADAIELLEELAGEKLIVEASA